MSANFNYKVPGDKLQEDLNSIVPKTLWQKIYLHLKKLGYEVYSPGQKRDKCSEGYIVIKENGEYGQVGAGNKIGYRLFDFIIYYPIGNYSNMEFYIESIKQALEEIKEIRATGNSTPVFPDDKIDAYTVSIEYQALRRLRR
ncbi:hypothetical protein [Clostridium botulinum]|uniref:hypothetical protein n=1 Tax=Clostridium botulinum TaxID=1491 RepID=UPI0004D347FE|nr:hypothetical protein [Clostridium botulinum]KEH90486.1 hypothetical protein Z963_p0043 [Clostridium botulinum C/D str. It1]